MSVATLCMISSPNPDQNRGGSFRLSTWRPSFCVVIQNLREHQDTGVWNRSPDLQTMVLLRPNCKQAGDRPMQNFRKLSPCCAIGATTHTPVSCLICERPCPAGQTPARLTWQARTPHGTEVRFQIRTAAGRDGLADAPWQETTGSDSWYDTSNIDLNLDGNTRWLQYRVALRTPDGGSTPVLEEVRISLK